MNTPEPEENKAETPADAVTALETEQISALPDLDATQVELEKYKDLALRCQAELDNYRKRIVREKDDAIRYANTVLLERLLPIVDNFELGLAEAAKNGADSSGILIGMQMVQKQFCDFLRDSGVQAIQAIGQPFDPNLHEAISQEHSDQIPEGYIIRQLRSGYKLRDRLLRPSTVIVSKGTPDKDPANQNTVDT